MSDPDENPQLEEQRASAVPGAVGSVPNPISLGLGALRAPPSGEQRTTMWHFVHNLGDLYLSMVISVQSILRLEP